MGKKSIIYAIMGVVLLSLVVIFFFFNHPIKSNEKTISATFFPIKEITSAVVGDKFKVVSVIPDGVEPHDYEPTTEDIKNMHNSIVLFGLGLEFSDIEKNLASTNPSIQYIVLSDNLSLLKPSAALIEEDKSLVYDPHVWNSFKDMIQMTKKVRDEMIKIDPSNSDYYSKNADAYLSKLTDLDNNFSTELKNCKTRTIFTSHAAFAYLAQDYNLTQFAISGLTPDAEPNPQKLKELVDLAKTNNITYIFYEELVDPRVSETIAREIGAKTLELSPEEGSKDGRDYITIMEDNLKNLKIALSC